MTTANLGFEDKLWEAANKLRGNMDASEYKHVVLPLIFLKYISDAFENVHEKLISLGRNPDRRDEYLARGVFWVPDDCRWKSVVEKALDPSIGNIIDAAMDGIEKDNPELKNVLFKNFGSTKLSPRVLGELVTVFGNCPSFADENTESTDIIGSVYEYFIGKFAEAEKRSGGEFYTPGSVVRLLVEMIRPFEGRIYDGCCGSGGMFVQSLKFMEAHSGRINTSVWGQESNPTTWRLAKMNLAIRRIEANLGEGHGDTLHENNFPDLRADFVLTNPPFNVTDWGSESLQNDVRWKYGVPPKKNANFAWIQHYLHHLSPTGVAAILMSNGSLSTSKSEELVIRQGIINDNKIDCIIMLPDKLFTNTPISACIWILNNRKVDPKYRERSGEILLIDCRTMGRKVTRKLRELTPKEIGKISSTYNHWISKEEYHQYNDELGFCKAVTLSEIEEEDHIVVPGRYVGAPPLPIGLVQFNDIVSGLSKSLSEEFINSHRLENDIRDKLRGIGFEI